MGKGTIKSGGAAGLYTVTVNYKRDNYTAEITRLTSQISDYQSIIAGLPEGRERNIKSAMLLGFEKRKSYLENNMPDDKDISVWCADTTEDLTGEIGLIEVPGESVDFNIQPGYESNAVYNATRDGQLAPTVAQTSVQAFYNMALLPGWQKWKPTYRYATITAINGDIASVDLDMATSTQQSLNINQEGSLTGISIEYMDCDGDIFEVGDTVLIKFDGQNWLSPKIVGFKDSPKECFFLLNFAEAIPETGDSHTPPFYDVNIPSYILGAVSGGGASTYNIEAGRIFNIGKEYNQSESTIWIFIDYEVDIDTETSEWSQVSAGLGWSYEINNGDDDLINTISWNVISGSFNSGGRVKQTWEMPVRFSGVNFVLDSFRAVCFANMGHADLTIYNIGSHSKQRAGYDIIEWEETFFGSGVFEPKGLQIPVMRYYIA